MSPMRPILLVEDDNALREVLADHFTSSGLFHIFEAATLAEARQHLDAPDARFDSIILDIGLPDGDGRDFCAQIRKQGHSMPVIMLTGASTETDVISGFDAVRMTMSPSHSGSTNCSRVCKRSFGCSIPPRMQSSL